MELGLRKSRSSEVNYQINIKTSEILLASKLCIVSILLRKETKIIIDSDLAETDVGQHFVIDFFMIDPVKKFL